MAFKQSRARSTGTRRLCLALFFATLTAAVFVQFSNGRRNLLSKFRGFGVIATTNHGRLQVAAIHFKTGAESIEKAVENDRGDLRVSARPVRYEFGWRDRPRPLRLEDFWFYYYNMSAPPQVSLGIYFIPAWAIGAMVVVPLLLMTRLRRRAKPGGFEAVLPKKVMGEDECGITKHCTGPGPRR